jgi:hypothetical protein
MILPGVLWDWDKEGRRGGLREDTGAAGEDIVEAEQQQVKSGTMRRDCGLKVVN